LSTSPLGSVTFRLTGEIDGTPVCFDLQKGGNPIGSHPDNSIRLTAPQISRRHAVITVNGTDARLTDLNSKNGTFVNGVKVRKKHLSENDWVQVGPIILTLEALMPDDRILAISTSAAHQAPTRPEDGELDDQDRSTELGLGSDRFRPWIEALDACAAEALGAERSDPAAAVGALSLAEPSAGFLLLRSAGQDGAMVEACSGDPGSLSLVEPAIISGLHPGTGCVPHIGTLPLNFGRPAVAFVHWTSTGWSTALVIIGVAISSPLRPLMETALRILISTLGHDLPTPPPQTNTTLSFPSWHVVSHSAPMQALYGRLAALGPAVMPILVTGETGVGKEHIVRILHQNSGRSDGPLQVVNCTAIPKDLLEAELFGIEKGVATGVDRRIGKMRLASGGTLLLDEIGDMDPVLQSKLLRVLQEGKVHPVGAPEPIPVDIRFVAATHADLGTRVRQGRFREDLYYRIAGCEVHVPALRDRREDIPSLVRYFLNRALEETRKSLRGISLKAMEHLVEAPWPGNVRQLGREIERLVALCPAGRTIESSMISPSVLRSDLAPTAPQETADLNIKRRLEVLERRLIVEALERSDGNHSEAARLLGVTRNGLTMKMGRLGISA